MLDNQASGRGEMGAAVAMAPSSATTLAFNLFYPLNEFYDRAGVPLPSVVRVEGSEVPEPYRSLLVHDRDMTPTLTEYYQRTMQLRILKRVLTETVFAREIVLEVEGQGKTAVYAAIKIYLDLFPPEAKRQVLEGKLPFGTVLQTQGMIHSSWPQAFLRVAADETINRALGITGHSVLYGRRSALLNTAQMPLAQVLEIVPPAGR